MVGNGVRREIALINHSLREVSMTGHSWERRAKWFPMALVATAAIALYGAGGSAQAAASGGPTGKDIVLAGFTAQHFPVFFKVSGDGKMVMVDGIAVSMRCTSGGTLIWNDTFGRVSIHANGRMHASYASPTILTNGTSYSVSDALVARLNPKHSQLTGTWQLAVNFGFSDGTTDQCDSGPVAFSATS
jgi:hypothetical protein